MRNFNVTTLNLTGRTVNFYADELLIAENVLIAEDGSSSFETEETFSQEKLKAVYSGTESSGASITVNDGSGDFALTDVTSAL